MHASVTAKRGYMEWQRDPGFLLIGVAHLYTRRFEERARGLALTLAQCKTLAVLANCEGINHKRLSQVADLLDALSQDAKSLATQTRALATAASSLELARESYGAGSTGVLQVLDAQRQRQQAQLGFVRAQAQQYLDTTQLFLALGGSSI
jgi:outer membrane protein TolC